MIARDVLRDGRNLAPVGARDEHRTVRTQQREVGVLGVVASHQQLAGRQHAELVEARVGRGRNDGFVEYLVALGTDLHDRAPGFLALAHQIDVTVGGRDHPLDAVALVGQRREEIGLAVFVEAHHRAAALAVGEGGVQQFRAVAQHIEMAAHGARHGRIEIDDLVAGRHLADEARLAALLIQRAAR